MRDGSPHRGSFWRTSVHAAGHLIGFLSTVPLIVAGLTVVAQQHFGWRSILLFLLMAFANWAMMNNASLRDINSSIDELATFREDFPHLRFMQVPVAEYLKVLIARVPGLQSKKENQILPLSATLGARTRILVYSANVNPLPPQLVTFANSLGAWIIIADTPDRLSGLGYFKLLHEMGHTAWLSIVSRLGSNLGVRYMAWPGVFLALMIAPTRMQAVALLALAIGWYATARADRTFLHNRARLYDEIAADCFALERCGPTWFEKYPQDQLVEYLTMAEHGGEPTPKTEVLERASALKQNLDRVRQGQPLQTLRTLTPSSAWQSVSDVLLVALLIACGLLHAPLSLGRMSLLAGVTLLAIALAIVTLILCRLTEDFADNCLGLKELLPWQMDMLSRITAIRQRRKRAVS